MKIYKLVAITTDGRCIQLQAKTCEEVVNMFHTSHNPESYKLLIYETNYYTGIGPLIKKINHNYTWDE